MLRCRWNSGGGVGVCLESSGVCVESSCCDVCVVCGVCGVCGSVREE